MSINFASTIDLKQSGTSRLVGAGGMLKPVTPSFSAYGTSGAIAEGNWIVFPSVIYNIGSGYNPANGLYSAPVGGVYYFFSYFLAESSFGGEYRQALYKNSGLYSGGVYIQTKGTDGYWTMRCGSHIQMAAGDYVGMYRQVTGTGVTHANGAYYAFGGHLVT